MEAWSSPELPSLGDAGFGSGPALHLHDTVTDGLVEAASDGRARMYVCGITPYDATHLGHAATYIAYDLALRVWRDAGVEISYTQNVTDVDDPLLARARQSGIEWDELAAQETQLFRDDMAGLGVIAPDHYIGAVETIPLVVDLIERLRKSGATYDVDGDVYFDSAADPDFGSVSGLDRDAMLALSAERGGDPDRPGKKNPVDALLWRLERPGEPSWPAPFGAGRPGWHVECAAMALEYLGMGFDVQGGGSDLVFPHHEFSASHAQAATGQAPFARAYVHAGMVGLDGQKMSKSKGNLVLVSTLREEGRDPAAIRLALLAHHYRSDWDWTPADLEDAEARLARWRDAVAHREVGDARPTVEAVRSALVDDLDAPRALAAVDVWVHDVLHGPHGPSDPDGAATIRTLTAALLGISL